MASPLSLSSPLPPACAPCWFQFNAFKRNDQCAGFLEDLKIMLQIPENRLHEELFSIYHLHGKLVFRLFGRGCHVWRLPSVLVHSLIFECAAWRFCGRKLWNTDMHNEYSLEKSWPQLFEDFRQLGLLSVKKKFFIESLSWQSQLHAVSFGSSSFTCIE